MWIEKKERKEGKWWSIYKITEKMLNKIKILKENIKKRYWHISEWLLAYTTKEIQAVLQEMSDMSNRICPMDFTQLH